MKRGFILFFLLASFLTARGQSTGKYQIKFLEINKSNSDYGVAILDENKLIFTSADDSPTKENKNHNSRKDLYVGDIDYDGEIKNVKPVVTKMDKKFNQTGLAYTADKKTVYFSRNKYWKKKNKQNNDKNKNLQLYSATVEADGSWTNIEKLSFNKKGSTISHPVLSADNKQLYFVSDMKPSKGKTDIFVVDILENGKYSKPRNLGDFVNTAEVETTPYISKDNILYFSSDGHPGKGMLDVFAVEVYDDDTSDTYQLASPVNSINDDFAYIVNEDNNQGFFTSNRLQGKGFNDLYSFTLEEDVRPGECFITVDGRVRDKESLELLAGATVDLYTLNGELLESVSTYDDGTYKLTVSCAKEYKLKASNPDYESDEKRIEILEENYHTALHANLNLSRIRDAEVANPMPAATLQPIYYEFDKASITASAAEKMNKIVEIMKANTDLVIEASSFTDSRGTDSYNLALSRRRAKAAVEYLMSQGIDGTRIKAAGYGEDKLINQCVNGTNCDEHSHQMNRRTEFNFVNNPSSRSKAKTSGAKSAPVKRTKIAAPAPVKKKDVKGVAVQNAVVPKTIEVTAPIATISEPEKSLPKVQAVSTLKVNATEVETLTINEQEIAAVNIEPIKVEKVMPLSKEAQPASKEPVFVEAAVSKSVIEKTSTNKTDVAPIKTDAAKVASVENKKEVYRASRPEAPKQTSKNDLISEEREEIASIEREKASYRTDEKQFGKIKNEEVQEAVVINYNSTIVATNPESNKVLNYIGTEKTKMIEQLNEIEKQYEEAIVEYPMVSDSLTVEKQRIGDIIFKAENLEETGWSNIIEYKNSVLHFKRRYRELLVQNNRGTISSNEINSGPGSIELMDEPAKSTKMTTEVTASNEGQTPSNSLLIKENLTVDNVEITAMKRNGNGKYQVTKNANKTDLIKVTFKLKSNQKVDIGRKEAHLVLQNPEGNVAEAKGIFTIKESQEESKYTDHAIINYNNHDVAVTMFVQRKGTNFEKGVYPIKLFVEGELMSVSNLDLKNQY